MSDKQFPELVDKIISRRLEAMWTCIPAIVDSVNHTNYTCSIRPKVKIDSAELPIIPDVPILAMKGGSSVILMPVAAGDIVLALFSKYALTELLKDKNPADHKDVRRFSIDDAMVLPGLFTSVDSVPAHDSSKVCIIGNAQVIGSAYVQGNLTFDQLAGTAAGDGNWHKH